MPRSAETPNVASSRLALAADVIDTCRKMNALGINQGTSGNISVRLDADRFLMTPSGMPYADMRPEDVPVMDMDGRWWGKRRPSVEWRFHRDILKGRPEAAVVLHTHSVFSTSMACLRLDIPAFHYMVAVAGGDSIRCADYATFGTQELSDNALKALKGRRACLLANHGVIALGQTLERTLALTVEVETLAAMYCRARQLGDPIILDKREMVRVLERFPSYGTPDFKDADLVHGGETL
jgi:L-fuculose-phosphate aldolase